MLADSIMYEGVKYVRAAESLKIPPRHDAVAKARWDLSQAIHALLDAHELSYAELQMLLADQLASWSQYQVRDEWSGPKDGACPVPREPTGTEPKRTGRPGCLESV